MAPRQEQQALPAQFSLQNGSNAGALVLSSGNRKARSGAPVLASQRSAPLAGACSFTTRAAGTVGKRMLVIKPAGGAAMGPALPLAALSLSLPPWKGKKEVAPPPKKKKTPQEVLQTAAKSALRGGLPGMGAMAIQVRRSGRSRSNVSIWHDNALRFDACCSCGQLDWAEDGAGSSFSDSCAQILQLSGHMAFNRLQPNRWCMLVGCSDPPATPPINQPLPARRNPLYTLQVLSLMWLRTTVNYEYRYGGGMMNVRVRVGWMHKRWACCSLLACGGCLCTQRPPHHPTSNPSSPPPPHRRPSRLCGLRAASPASTRAWPPP